LKERDHLEDLGTDVRIMSKWIIKKYDEGWGEHGFFIFLFIFIWTGVIWLRTGTSAGLL
jgi:hypothetical protein